MLIFAILKIKSNAYKMSVEYIDSKIFGLLWSGEANIGVQPAHEVKMQRNEIFLFSHISVYIQ